MIFPRCGHQVEGCDDLDSCPLCDLLGKRKGKYNARPVKDPVDGYFHSTGEYKRWCDLRLLERAGNIKNLQRQQTFALGHETLTVDFTYEDQGQKIAEDYKGCSTKDWKRKRKAWPLYQPDWRLIETGKAKAGKNHSPHGRHQQRRTAHG